MPRGFTLLEVLVVLLILGVCAGLIGTLARPDARDALRIEAERLAMVLELAADESRLTGKPIVWTAAETPGGMQYRFERWGDDTGWSEARDYLLRARSLPAGMTLSDLRIETLQAPFGMRLEFGALGPPAYDLRIAQGETRYTLGASMVGAVRIHNGASSRREE